MHHLWNCRDHVFVVFLETSCHPCFEVTGLVSVHFANEMVAKLRAKFDGPRLQRKTTA